MALRTKNAIRRSFMELLAERPFDKISVRDIAERSEVTRNTFYYYYTDIYALAEDVFESEIEKISGGAREYDSWQKAFLAAISFASQNRRAILHLYDSAHRSILERATTTKPFLPAYSPMYRKRPRDSTSARARSSPSRAFIPPPSPG